METIWYMSMEVALIVSCKLRGFGFSDEYHFFFHSLISAGMDTEGGRS